MMTEQTQLAFRKMNGLGNDFVVLDARTQDFDWTPEGINTLANREKGVGCDQVIILQPARNDGDVFMGIWNADGSEAPACGNGARCVGALLLAQTGKERVAIETEGGLIHATRAGEDTVTVNMGEPRLAWHEIPLAEEIRDTRGIELQIGPIDAPILHTPAAVNVGNPHAIFFVDDPEAYDLDQIGPLLESHPVFPERANISLARVDSHDHITLRVWERGAGLTRACGTAACAATVASVRKDLTGRTVTVTLPGGDLHIEWQEEDNHIYMTGPARLDYESTLDAVMLTGQTAP